MFALVFVILFGGGGESSDHHLTNPHSPPIPNQVGGPSFVSSPPHWIGDLSHPPPDGWPAPPLGEIGDEGLVERPEKG